MFVCYLLGCFCSGGSSSFLLVWVGCVVGRWPLQLPMNFSNTRCSCIHWKTLTSSTNTNMAIQWGQGGVNVMNNELRKIYEDISSHMKCYDKFLLQKSGLVLMWWMSFNLICLTTKQALKTCQKILKSINMEVLYNQVHSVLHLPFPPLHSPSSVLICNQSCSLTILLYRGGKSRTRTIGSSHHPEIN